MFPCAKPMKLHLLHAVARAFPAPPSTATIPESVATDPGAVSWLPPPLAASDCPGAAVAAVAPAPRRDPTVLGAEELKELQRRGLKECQPVSPEVFLRRFIKLPVMAAMAAMGWVYFGIPWVYGDFLRAQY